MLTKILETLNSLSPTEYSAYAFKSTSELAKQQQTQQRTTHLDKI